MPGKKTADRNLTRSINRFQVLERIRREGPISRVELAEATGQSRALVTNITAELIERNIIFEKAARPSGGKGRRRVLLALNPEAAYVAGVKVMGRNVSIVITDFQAGVRSSQFIPVQVSERSVGHLATIIQDGIVHCAREARLDPSSLSGIGLALPGFVDHVSGRCLWTPIHTDTEAPLRDLVLERMGVPTYVENDANALALAELWFGHGVGLDDFIVVTVEQGVGMGMVVHGQLYRGGGGIGAEFGHVIVKTDGPSCRCGKRGCIESFAGGSGILQAAKKAHSQGKWEHPNIDMLTMDEIITLAYGGEKVLAGLLRKGGEVLGMGVAGLMQVFNPSRVIVTGQYVHAGELYFGPMHREIRKRVNKPIFDSTEMVMSEWENTDWARGAASVVLQELYRSPYDKIRPLG